jgi:heterodisulfide reductase subunit C
MIQQVFFAIVSIFSLSWAWRKFMRIRRNILLGQDENFTDQEGTRWKNVALIAFGQKKMFQQMVPAVLHLFIYVAFLFTQIELIEIFIDGFFGVHRFFAPYLGVLYSVIISTIELLSVGALIATIVFLARRNLLKLPRFHMDEMTGWPKLDANLILFGELLLLTGIFTMNGTDVVLQKLDPAHYPSTGTFAISSFVGPLLFGNLNEGILMLMERFGWWLHILTVFAFLIYLAHSKHLHIMLAFPNTYYSRLQPKGEMSNMPAIMNEVKSMMGLTGDSNNTTTTAEIPTFGANDVFTLSWKNIMEAYTCTECGRCSSVCPANLTGKKLSPRKIMMDIRDRAEEVGEKLDSGKTLYIKKELQATATQLTKDNFDDGKSLFDYISREEIHACTTCNACVEACPVLISPLDAILQLRRYEILTESAGPKDWVPMFTAIENGGAVWQMSDARDKWAVEAMAKDSDQ